MQSKNQIRSGLLRRRESMAADEAADNSNKVCQRLMEFGPFRRVMVYLSAGNECSVDGYLQCLLKKGVEVCVPVCTGPGIMEASLLKDPALELEKGTFDIRAPKKEYRRFVSKDSLDAVIVPGVGFTEEGGRLGFGGGFYDRFLPQTKKDCLKIAVCHGFQLTPEFIPEDHDFPMDFIVTEDKVITCKNNKR